MHGATGDLDNNDNSTGDHMSCFVSLIHRDCAKRGNELLRLPSGVVVCEVAAARFIASRTDEHVAMWTTAFPTLQFFGK